MKPSPLDLLTAGAAELGVFLDDSALSRFSVYLALLQQWGRKINLTTRLGSEEIVIYHFLDSLAGAPLLAESAGDTVVDLGSGAGLPSLPLKFALPSLRMLLVESVHKKVAFCQEVVRATGVANVTVAWGRGEAIGATPPHHRAYDWAVSRALGHGATVAELALPFLAPGGQILLYKGRPDPDELQGIDAFCARHGARREMRTVAVPHLDGVRSLITIRLPKGPGRPA